MPGLAEPQVPEQPPGQQQRPEGAISQEEIDKGPVTMPEGDDQSIGASIETGQASGEEQAMYEALAEPMLGLIHGPETAPKVKQQLKDGKTVGEITYNIATAIVGQIEQAGKQVPYEPLQEAAQDVVEDLVEMQMAMGLIPDDDGEAYDQAVMEGLMEAIEMYGITQRQSGKLSPEEAQEHFDSAVKLGGFDKGKISDAVQRGIANGQ